MRHLVNLQDYSESEIQDIIRLALRLKSEQKKGISHPLLPNKALGMIFSKASTRTRVSFEVGIRQLGGYGLFLNSSDIQLGRGETIEDTAKVLSRYLDGIMIRTFAQEDVEELAKYSSIPIINGLTDMFHPCQILADLMTIHESKGKLKGLRLAYVGDGNNVAHSLLIGCSKMGLDITIACPIGYEPQRDIVDWAIDNGKSSGSLVNITTQPKEAVGDADIIYTDVWTSMGQEGESNERLKVFTPYQVNQDLLSLAKPNAIFLHCLPAHRGEEVTSEVIDGPQSLVFEEAENRLHVQKAVLVSLMGGL
ncbi:MAG TPA: ornithine carbamoyltransferase [Clostridia bacterium]|nr:ornithine carbamoyltransferase [Clostridia bacterium]